MPEHYGHTSARNYLAFSGENNHENLLRAANDLSTTPAWNAIEAQRARWIAELPAKCIDLLPWLVQQDPATTLLDLLAFCTGTLLDGIEAEKKPHAINALAGALNLDMTRYWTPTRASYFDHVSKARIADVVAPAVSPKIAADLGKMKKTDAAAAAELRLAKAAWLPEILTDREIPAAPSWNIHVDEDGADAGNGEGETQDDEIADAEADVNKCSEHINNTPRNAEASPVTRNNVPQRPLPTAASESIASADRHDA